MCGIVGMAGDISSTDRKIFKHMMYMNQFRGRDSSGVVRVAPNNDVYSLKRVGVPEYLFETSAYDKQIDQNSKVLIGHCRAKTIGEASVKNAHPFEFENVIGVHNGTIHNIYNLERRNDFGTDSEWLYWHISEYGPEATFSILPEDQAWSCVWWDKDEQTLNFIRNDKRPMYVAHSKDQKVLYWASEPGFFYPIRREKELWTSETNQNNYQTRINHLCTWDIDWHKNKAEEILKLRPLVEIIPKEVKKSNSNFQGNHGSNGYSSYGTKGGSGTTPFLKDDGLENLPGTSTQNGKTGTTPGANTTTETTSKSSTTSTSTPSDSASGQNTSKTSSRTKDLLTTSTSLTCPSNNNGKQTKLSRISSRSSIRTSVRQVGGMEFLTDIGTGVEYGEASFDALTNSTCCHCKEPIGSLSEVYEVFSKPGKNSSVEGISFVCNACVTTPPDLQVVVEGVN